ncbi:unnamed protein product, partial [Prorocentrum cordatum]
RAPVSPPHARGRREMHAPMWGRSEGHREGEADEATEEGGLGRGRELLQLVDDLVHVDLACSSCSSFPCSNRSTAAARFTPGSSTCRPIGSSSRSSGTPGPPSAGTLSP